ncbi:TrkH-domain-containing protein [Fomitiporia mediterranea MF3/22]|uniref:TrkH-domain-containing protein n=1 Tax=Fomitiporia mediterranea (strain MF3/22) TaxID=694068 RepID=UPI0004407B66|nr:TrkH-domain-containing protein [Fomitiporia mediterranea MF3/22]EJD08005.1 TrkH-domain-containing protein [Fomitiporia mediterranea MF3/22]
MVTDHLNFFRVHVLFFTFAPLVFSWIFYGANGATHIPYIDALYVCFSATTVCGLSTIDLSSLTGFQQALLFIQSAIGNQVVVSWVMVYIRRRYFHRKLQYIVEAEVAKRKELAALEESASGRRRLTRFFTRYPTRQDSDRNAHEIERDDHEKGARQSSLEGRIIRRTSEPPRRVDPNGLISDPVPVPNQGSENATSAFTSKSSTLRNDRLTIDAGGWSDKIRAVGNIDPIEEHLRASHEGASAPEGNDYFGLRVESPAVASSINPSIDIIHDDRTYIPPGGAPLRRRTTVWTTRRQSTRQQILRGIPEADEIVHEEYVPSRPAAKNRGYGGFPYPTTYLYRLLQRAYRRLRNRFMGWRELKPTVTSEKTIPYSNTRESGKMYDMTKTVKYFSDSFNALIGRNSKFYDLTEENLEELGGVEYRALNALLWIVATYHILTQLLSFAIIAPYLSIRHWVSVFNPPSLHQHVSPVWYSAFQVVSAYTTCGLSLVDQSMVPFQEAYPLIFVCTFLIFAGFLAYPVFLRFFIWSIMKLIPNTRLNETLHFLLDHPRRCYIYLFPSHQTRLLLLAIVLLHCVDYFFFLVLNIGAAAYETIPLGVRFAVGILQATSARAAGFAIVSISSLAPALQVLFVIVMYLGVYPIALSVQATNVYEEKSLGVFEDEEEAEETDFEPKVEDSQPSSYGRYMAWHARRQLAFDMWWLGLVLFVLCIIERGKIQNSDNFEWFTIFALIFEIISAYTGVGMSLGVPYANFSFSGAFTPLSKLIMVAVMLRGRHRGLPVAIDRAVMLPFEFQKAAPSDGATTEEGHYGENGARMGNTDHIAVLNRIIGDDRNSKKQNALNEE